MAQDNSNHKLNTCGARGGGGGGGQHTIQIIVPHMSITHWHANAHLASL